MGNINIRISLFNFLKCKPYEIQEEELKETLLNSVVAVLLSGADKPYQGR